MLRDTNRKFVGHFAYFQLARRSHHLVAEDDATMPNDNRVHEMEQQFNELRQAIAKDIAERFEASERRLRDGLSKDLAARFEAGEQRLREGLSKDLDARFEAREQRLRESLSRDVARQLETAQQHLEGCMQMHAEDLKGHVTMAAEGYGGTLNGIQRELKDFRAEWRQKADDTDGILANHAGRLVALEQTRSRD